MTRRGRDGDVIDDPVDDEQHRPGCDGWLGEDYQGRPIPCLVCRPHLPRLRGRLRLAFAGRIL